MAAADKCQPTIIGMSALLTTTMTYMKTVIDGFEAAGQRRTSRWRSAARRSARCSPTRSAPTATAQNASAAVDLFLRLAQARPRDARWRPTRFSTGRKSRRRSRPRTTTTTSRCRCREVQERIDALAAERGLSGSRRLPGAVALERRTGPRRHGRRTSPRPCARELEAQAGLVTSRSPMPQMPVTLHRSTARRPTAVPGLDALRAAERLGVRVPTSCQKQGKCKECVVEVDRRAWSCCRRRPPEEQHLEGPLPAVVPDAASSPTTATSAATRCGAGRCASSAGCARASRPATPGIALDPAVTRDGDRILIDGVESRPLDRPDPRPRDGPRHDDDRAAAVRPRDRRAGRRRLVREPAALRRLGRDGAHPVRHRASRASC